MPRVHCATCNPDALSAAVSRYFHGVEAAIEGKRSYMPSRTPARDLRRDLAAAQRRYVWDYEGSRTKLVVLSVLLVVAAIAICLFPVWPYFMKRGAQLLSMTTLIVMVSGISLRLLVFGTSWLVGYSLWLFPNLFDEEKEIFSPIYTFERAEKVRHCPPQCRFQPPHFFLQCVHLPITSSNCVHICV